MELASTIRVAFDSTTEATTSVNEASVAFAKSETWVSTAAEAVSKRVVAVVEETAVKASAVAVVVSTVAAVASTIVADVVLSATVVFEVTPRPDYTSGRIDGRIPYGTVAFKMALTASIT